MNPTIRILFTLLVTGSAILVCCDAKVLVKRAAPVCGSPTRQAGFIFGGNRSTRGEFPWLVALMFAGTSPPSLIGGGTLISDRHVVTAAHCVKPKDGPFTQLYPADVIVQFGAFNLSNPHELGKHSLAPEQIIVHNDWNPNVARYDADIALLVFEEGDIPLTRYVQPVCLWSSSTAPPETEGMVAGWGRSEDDTKFHEELPKKIKLPIRTNEDCLIKSPSLVKLFSKRTFCAGLDDGSGVCMGDSGNGFIVRSGAHAYLRGIVSSSLLSGTSCDVNNYAIYTDVMKYKRWIDENMGVTVPVEDDINELDELFISEVTCDVSTIDINSQYFEGDKNVKMCSIKNQAIEAEGTVIRSTRDAATVEGVSIEKNKDVKFMPEKLGQTFPELKLLQVQFCGVKSIQAKHFANLRKLVYLSLFGNEIETVGNGAFGDLPSLKTLYLSNNENLKTIDGNMFSGVPNLKFVWIDKLSLSEVPENLFRKTPQITRICLKNNQIRYVSPRTFDGLANLRTVILVNNVCANKFYTFDLFADLKTDLAANCLR